jgi:hypothetical protein
MPGNHEEFLAAFKAAAGITVMPAPIQISPVTSQSDNGPGTSRQFGRRRRSTSVSANMTVDLSTEEQKIIEIISNIQRALELTMIIPWTVYMDTIARLEIALSLKKLNTEYFTIEATEGATMDVDDEDTADRQQLQELVRKQYEANTKSLQQDLKNSSRRSKAYSRQPQKTARGPTQRLKTKTKRWKRPRKSQVRSLEIAPHPQKRKSIRPRSRRCRQRFR